jgi:hypothetical protein
MSKRNCFKKLTLGVFMAAACGAGQSAYAHTGVKDTATEGKTLYTAFTLGHGCQDTPEQNEEAKEKLLPVKAQSAVFPNGTGSKAYRINANGTDGDEIELSDYISGANGGVLTLAPGMVQDKNVFKKQRELTDAQGNVRAIHFTAGNLDTTAVGLIPFKVSAPKFTATVGNDGETPNCAKSLKIRIAIANYCNASKSTDKDNRSDLWIGHLTPKFNDPGVMPHDYETSPFWPTLTVNRNLPEDFEANCGDGFDIAVQPSDAEIDAYLPVKGFWPK